MNKSILIIDTPECCDKCTLYDYRTKLCYGTDNDIFTHSFDNFEEERCVDCPLRDLPQEREFGKRNILPIKVDGNSFVLGWNACLKEITGETE